MSKNKYDPNGGKPRLVQALHKRHVNPDTNEKHLAVGKTFRFDSGKAYTVQADGSVRNAKPKLAKGKAYRKALKKIRQTIRERKTELVAAAYSQCEKCQRIFVNDTEADDGMVIPGHPMKVLLENPPAAAFVSPVKFVCDLDDCKAEVHP